jgi:hypothetical protein
MKNKQPFIPIFFGDFLASTSEWEGEEKGLYILLLCHQWSIGSLPIEPVKLYKLVSYDKDSFINLWKTVSTKFVEIDGRLINLRLEAHRSKAAEISSKRAAAGANGGKVAQAKYKGLLESSEANQQNLLGHPNQSNPNQTNLSIPKSKNKTTALRPKDIDEKVWNDFLVLRRAKKLPLTDSALNGIVREAGKAGLNLQEAIVVCCERGWAGFKAEWFTNPVQRPGVTTFEHSNAAASRAFLGGSHALKTVT